MNAASTISTSSRFEPPQVTYWDAVTASRQSAWRRDQERALRRLHLLHAFADAAHHLATAVAPDERQRLLDLAGAAELDRPPQLAELLGDEAAEDLELRRLLLVLRHQALQLPHLGRQGGGRDSCRARGTRSSPVRQEPALPGLGVLGERQHGAQVLDHLQRVRHPVGRPLTPRGGPAGEVRDQAHRQDGGDEAGERTERQPLAGPPCDGHGERFVHRDPVIGHLWIRGWAQPEGAAAPRV